MLAPIVTKDMKLFGPIPPNVKNVRSRAHSLNELKSCASTPHPQQHGRNRSSQSTGNIPVSSKCLMKSSVTRKQSKLDAIFEGVELASCNGTGKEQRSRQRTVDRYAKGASAVVYTDGSLSQESCDANSLNPATLPSEKRSGGWSKSVVRRISNVLKSKPKTIGAS